MAFQAQAPLPPVGQLPRTGRSPASPFSSLVQPGPAVAIGQCARLHSPSRGAKSIKQQRLGLREARPGRPGHGALRCDTAAPQPEPKYAVYHTHRPAWPPGRSGAHAATHAKRGGAGRGVIARHGAPPALPLQCTLDPARGLGGVQRLSPAPPWLALAGMPCARRCPRWTKEM